MATLTVENYVKTIYLLGPSDQATVATGQVAAALGVSPGTVTSMLKTLSASGLATYTPYEGVQLTPSGCALALRILRRHRLIELFLQQTLGLTWDEVHEEAEHMEHAVSDMLIDRIDQFLSFPEFDPHGDPIPTAAGQVPQPSGQALANCPAGISFRLVRVLDQSPDFLRYLTETGLSLGTEGHVLSNRPEADVVTLQLSTDQVSLGRRAAEMLLVSEM